jgi:hypothetical protein
MPDHSRPRAVHKDLERERAFQQESPRFHLNEAIVLVPLLLFLSVVTAASWAYTNIRGPMTEARISRRFPQVVGSSPSQQQAPSRSLASGHLSPVFSTPVLAWEEEIMHWSEEYDLPPDLIAIVMQLESCGHPRATSRAGAIGLFQVMPFHFSAEDDPYDPDTNARRGLAYLSRSREIAEGNIRRTLAGYNGGHGVIMQPEGEWFDETIRYTGWGEGIWEEVQRGERESATLQRWLASGGERLCRSAAAAQIPSSSGS